MGKPARLDLVAATLVFASIPRLASAQSVVDRTPNLDDGWTVPVGVIQFNFLHRFEVSAPPARKVTSFPNFHLATGLPLGVNFGLDYATNSTVFTGIPNEYQLTLRRPVLRETEGRPLDVSLAAGYNFAPKSADGELTVSAQTQDVGEAHESLPASFGAEALEIGFNAEFLRDGIDSVAGEQVRLKLISPLRPAVLQGEGDDFLYLIMPIRLAG